jgi:hypothetical protein
VRRMRRRAASLAVWVPELTMLVGCLLFLLARCETYLGMLMLDFLVAVFWAVRAVAVAQSDLSRLMLAWESSSSLMV